MSLVMRYIFFPVFLLLFLFTEANSSITYKYIPVSGFEYFKFGTSLDGYLMLWYQNSNTYSYSGVEPPQYLLNLQLQKAKKYRDMLVSLLTDNGGTCTVSEPNLPTFGIYNGASYIGFGGFSISNCKYKDGAVLPFYYYSTSDDSDYFWAFVPNLQNSNTAVAHIYAKQYQKAAYPQLFYPSGKPKRLDDCPFVYDSDGVCCSPPSSLVDGKCVSFGAELPFCAGLHGDYVPTFQGTENFLPIFTCSDAEPEPGKGCQTSYERYKVFCDYQGGEIYGKCSEDAYSRNIVFHCRISSSFNLDDYSSTDDINFSQITTDYLNDNQFDTDSENIDENILNQLKNSQLTDKNINESVKSLNEVSKKGFESVVDTLKTFSDKFELSSENNTKQITRSLDKIAEKLENSGDNGVSDKLDQINEFLNGEQPSNLDFDTSALEQQKQQEEQESIDAVNAVYSQYSEFYDNIINAKDTFVDSFENAKALFENGIEFNPTPQNDTSCFQFEIYGKHIDLNLCKYLKPFAPIFNFVIVLSFMILSLKISLIFFLRGE